MLPWSSHLLRQASALDVVSDGFAAYGRSRAYDIEQSLVGCSWEYASGIAMSVAHDPAPQIELFAEPGHACERDGDALRHSADYLLIPAKGLMARGQVTVTTPCG